MNAQGPMILVGRGIPSPHRDNEKIEVLVEVWPDGTRTIATRRHPGDIWSPPAPLEQERP